MHLRAVYADKARLYGHMRHLDSSFSQRISDFPSVIIEFYYFDYLAVKYRKAARTAQANCQSSFAS